MIGKVRRSPHFGSLCPHCDHTTIFSMHCHISTKICELV